MLSRNATKFVILAVNLAYKWGCIAYKIVPGEIKEESTNPEEKESSPKPIQNRPCAVQVNTSPFRKFLIIGLILLYSLYPPYLLIRLVLTLKATKNDPTFQGHTRLHFTIQMSYLSFGYAISSMFQLHYLLRWKDIPKMLALYLKYFNVQMPGKKLKVDKPKDRIVKKHQSAKAFAFLLIMTVLVTLQNLALNIKHPELPQCLTSLMKDPKGGPKLVKLGIMTVQVYLWLYFWIWCMLGINSYVLGYLSCFCLKLRQLEKSTKTWQSNPVATIRQLQVLHNYWQYNHQFIFIQAFCLSWSIGAILALYGAVRYPGLLAVKTAGTAVIVLSGLRIVITKCADVSTASHRFLDSWKNKGFKGKQARFLRVFLRSVKGFSVYIGRAFFVESTTILKVFDQIIGSAVNLILL